jgi:hypothetical protein
MILIPDTKHTNFKNNCVLIITTTKTGEDLYPRLLELFPPAEDQTDGIDYAYIKNKHQYPLQTPPTDLNYILANVQLISGISLFYYSLNENDSVDMLLEIIQGAHIYMDITVNYNEFNERIDEIAWELI